MNKILEEIINSNRYLIEKGNLADYIPALSKVDKDKIGITIMDINGGIYQVGDYSHKFTIQSISKVVSLILAIEDNGEEYVFKKVDYEPTEEPFNTLFKLDLPHTLKPANPMINAGAIVTTSLIKGEADEKFERLISLYRQITDNANIDYNREIYLSEKATGDKNRAMAYLMKSRDFIKGDVEDILDIYFKQCSIEVTTHDIAKMGLFIASRGDDILKDKANRIVTSIMATSGMYNFSGEYSTMVGIPSKSGVGGGIMGTIPNKMGIGVYNPSLDEYGNSIVGIGIMKDISDKLNLHMY